MIVFVFGSNLASKPTKGAMAHAVQEYGAETLINNGRSGNAYAIPVKDANFNTLPLPVIREYVNKFLAYAESYSCITFEVSRIGCGTTANAIIGDDDIKGLFANAPLNCQLPEGWRNV